MMFLFLFFLISFINCELKLDELVGGYISLFKDKFEIFYLLAHPREVVPNTSLLVWFNGGPGCSSMLGAFTENGPYQFNYETKELTKNPYSWNKHHFVLYIDQPPGVGFSKNNLHKPISDSKTAADIMLNFFYKFFQNYSTLRGIDLYIIGESYGGHYAPIIAYELLLQNFNFVNSGMEESLFVLKGVALGNGYIDGLVQYDYSDFAKLNNLLDENGIEYMTSLYESCKYFMLLSSETEFCGLVLSYLLEVNADKSIYNIKQECKKDTKGSIHCEDNQPLVDFLNSKDFKEYFGLEKDISLCNDSILYAWSESDRNYDFYEYIKRLLDVQVPVYIYNGDLDLVCNWMGTLKSLGADFDFPQDYNNFSPFYNIKDGSKKSGKVAGTYHKHKDYELYFIRIFEAGHMVPTDQPLAALTLIETIVEDGF